MFRPKHKFLIRYKSGAEMSVRADALTVKSIAGNATEMKWDNMQPKPMVLGIDNIESVWQVS